MVYIESANSLIVGGHNSWITMAGRRRPGFESKLGFRQAAPEGGGVHAALLKSARGSGQLNLSNRHLTQGTGTVTMSRPTVYHNLFKL